MRSIKLFKEKFKNNPLKAFAGLFMDYSVYFSLCFFALVLTILKLPFVLIEKLTGFMIRERFINLIMKISNV